MSSSIYLYPYLMLSFLAILVNDKKEELPLNVTLIQVYKQGQRECNEWEACVCR